MSLMSLDSRCKFILCHIINAYDYVSVEDISKAMNISKRSIYYDISKINDWLLSHKLTLIQTERQKGFFINENDKCRIKEIIEDIKNDSGSYYVFSPEERISAVICTIVSSGINVSVEKFAEMFAVSRNTMLNDLKTIKLKLKRYGLCLVYENKNGYCVKGDTIRKRAVFLYYLSTIIHLERQRLIDFIDYNDIQNNLDKLFEIENKLGTEYVDQTLLQLAILISVIKKGEEAVEINDSHNIAQTNEYALMEKYFPELNHDEHLYFAIYLLGARVAQITNKFIVKKDDNAYIYNLAVKMIDKFEQLACIEFNNREDLLKKLYMHLSSSVFRYRYGIIVGNPLEKEIESNYSELFHITKNVAKVLSSDLKCPIGNSEVAYLTLHFGAHLRSSGNKKGMVRVLLICHNGIATANMLKKELEELLPIIDIIDIISLKRFDNYQGIYDLIISTVEIVNKKNVITVNPVLTISDKKNILSYVYKIKGFTERSDELSKVFGMIKKYIPESNQMEAYEELKNHFNHSSPMIEKIDKKYMPCLEKLLEPDNINIVNDMDSWKEAIKLAAKPLLNKECITANYIDAMIKSVENFGSYIFITPEIALAHAKPEDGVNLLSFALLVVKNGVRFVEDKTAKIIIVLAPEDNEKHFKVLQEIVDYFSDENNIKKLINSQNEEEIYTKLIFERNESK